MVDIQLPLASLMDVSDHVEVGERFAVQLDSRGNAATGAVDRLDDVWKAVSERLSKLMSETKAFLETPYDLDSIEFNIGIEAGVAIGLVTKGDASITVTFKRATTDSKAPKEQQPVPAAPK